MWDTDHDILPKLVCHPLNDYTPDLPKPFSPSLNLAYIVL